MPVPYGFFYLEATSMEDLNQIKVFTLQEAEALLPSLSALLIEAKEARREIQKMEVEIDLEEIVHEGESSSRVDARMEEYNRQVAEFYDLIDKIHEPGCYLKDVEMGLIDFYSLRDGKVVYLCWKFGEPRITHWHDVNSGFSSREPL